MLLNTPGADLLDAKMLRIMRALDSSDGALSGREVARVIDAGKSATAETLATMIEMGVLQANTVGRSLQYTPNRAHFYWGIFTHLATFDAQLRDRLLRLVQPRGKALDPGHNALFLFGAGARGEAERGAAVDVGIIVQNQSVYKRLEAHGRDLTIVHEIEAFTGNRVELFMVDRATFASMLAGEDPLASAWGRDALTLWGTSPQALADELLGLPQADSVPAT